MKLKNLLFTTVIALSMIFSVNITAQTEGQQRDNADEIVDRDERQSLQNDAEKALQAFKTKDTNLQQHLDSAAGYALSLIHI